MRSVVIDGFLVRNEDTGNFWAVEIPALNIHTQGHTRKEAYEMAADATSLILDDEQAKIELFAKTRKGFKLCISELSLTFPIKSRVHQLAALDVFESICDIKDSEAEVFTERLLKALVDYGNRTNKPSNFFKSAKKAVKRGKKKAKNLMNRAKYSVNAS